MKLERLLAIIMLLMNRGRMTAKELAEYFEVSVRTIYRDLEVIDQAGIPIVTYQGANGGVGIVDRYKMDKQVLKPDEVLSIVAALKGVNSTLDDRRLQHIEEKMKTLIPRGAKGLWDDRIVIDFSPWGGNEWIKEKVSLLRKAMEEERMVEFFYTNAQGVARKRLVEPEKLILKGYMWYMLGYCHMRQDHRLFRLSRIREPQIGKERFVLRPLPDGELLEGRQTSEFRTIHIVMRFSPRVRVRVEDFFEAEQVEVQEDGSVIVRVNYPEDEWVYGTVLSYGCDVEVLEPPHLREIICARAWRMLELYGSHRSSGEREE